MVVNVNSLVLNNAWMPIEVVSWEKAVMLYFEKNAKIVASYDDIVLHSTSSSMLAPAVVMRQDVGYKKCAFTNVVPFNRENLFKRDNGTCMYCGRKVDFDNFSFEHVIPKSDGGKLWWDNIVVACLRCNGKKKNFTPKEAHMKLIRKPFIPKLDRPVPKKLIKKIGMRIPHKTWIDFIYWKVVLSEEDTSWRDGLGIGFKK